MDNRKTSVLISLDLSKAFDSIDHEILLIKMRKMRIGNKAIQLTRSYLANRQQLVKVGSSLSQPDEINRGITQGSILGPKFFSIYIADIQHLSTHSKIFKFADDVLLLLEINESDRWNPSEMINEDIRMLTNYFETNRLTINMNKSQAVIFGNGTSDHIKNILQSNGIALLDEIKYLGILIDNKLSFENFGSTIRSKLNQAIGAISVLRKKILTGSLLKFYFSHFQSHLMYGTFLLLRLSIVDLNQLQIQQNKILKMIYGLPFTTPTEEIFTIHAPNILPIMGTVFYVVCTMVHKSLNKNDGTLFNVEKLQSARQLILKGKCFKLTTKKNDIETIGPSLFNCLPNEIRVIKSSVTFKVRLKKFLLGKNASLCSKQQISSRNQII